MSHQASPSRQIEENGTRALHGAGDPRWSSTSYAVPVARRLLMLLLLLRRFEARANKRKLAWLATR